MAKKARQKRQTTTRKTNWLLIGGVVAVGIVALFALLFFSLQEPEVPTLAEYCEDNPERCVFRGDPNAPVTIVEVSDYGCTHCRTFHADTLPLLDAQYVATNQVRWIFLPYALSTTTLPASNAAMCANEQGAYKAFGDLLFNQQGLPIALTQEGFMQAAEQLNLDMDPFIDCMSSGRYNGMIQENVSAARNVRISATPSFMINGRLLEGAQPITVFQQRISAAAAN